MKKSITMLLAGIFISLASLSNAQQFWIEKWTGSTAQGQLTYTGPNGAWTVFHSGANGADSNVWYFSNIEGGEGRTMCGAGGGHATAHMGFTRNSPLMWPLYQFFNSATNPDQGAVIDDDSPDPTTTNQRLESPTINCTGKTNIKLSFNYIEGKADGSTAEASVWYYNGTTWALLSTPAELDSCTSGQGLWTYYSVALPASANGNANVKIGFNWTSGMLEHEDSIFDNSLGSEIIVSFAVDSVALSTISGAAPVANFMASDTIVCVGDSVHFTDLSTNTPTSWKWYFENGNPLTSTLQNPWVIYNTVGVDSVKLVVKNASGSDSVTVKKRIYVKSCGTGIPAIADNNNISLYPNPANSNINLKFANAISGNTAIEVTDITGRVISTQVLNASAGKIMSIDISNMASGMYIIKVTAGGNVYFDKFIKQ